jgi:hypothetical protein
MFHIQVPVAPLEVRARFQVYREFVERHNTLQDIKLGPHNDMIILADDPVSGAQSAVLVAQGKPGDLVKFPLHRHGMGEIQVCLEGIYGELLPLDQCQDDIFPWGETLVSFNVRYPGVIELGPSSAVGLSIKMHPGAAWNFVAASQHAPTGWIGPSGLLLAQIFWPGPNQVLPSGQASTGKVDSGARPRARKRARKRVLRKVP